MTTTTRGPRSGRLQKAAALVPLAVLSTAFTVSIAGVGVTAVVSAEAPVPSEEQLPEGATVPEQAIEAPASVSSGDEVAPGAPGNAQQIVDTASTNEIPAAALAAYQRAETVINAADTSCNLTWQLVAAIGRVESNHGRFGGNVLDEDGVARPGIYGIPLDGSNGTAVIRDTDAGQYDDDQVWDRAVGPMQFIPGTWSAIGVDADGDGERNPQDIDDAALGTAVYLCSGDDDLSTTAGQRSAVYRYNRSQSYVDLVLAIMNAYLDGDFTSVPTNTSAGSSVITPLPEDIGGGNGPRGGGGGNGGGGEAPVGEPAGEAPQAEPTEDPVPNAPDTGGDDGGDEGGDGGNGGGNGGGGNNGPVPPIRVPDLPDTNIPPVDDVLTLTEATLQCTLDGLNQLLNPQAFQQCLNDYMNP